MTDRTTVPDSEKKLKLIGGIAASSIPDLTLRDSPLTAVLGLSAKLSEVEWERDAARAEVAASVLALADEWDRREGDNLTKMSAAVRAAEVRAAVSLEGVAAHEARIKAQALREAAGDSLSIPDGDDPPQVWKVEVADWLFHRADAIEGRA